ncbi:MAG: VWA domain-containing protein [Flavipsychrobacter sp.]
MRVLTFILLCILLTSSWVVKAQQQIEKEPRILILLDGSSSMRNSWADNGQRFDAAGKIITELIDSVYKVNDQVEFALRVYGHQHPAQDNNCFDTRREVMFSKNNLAQMTLRLDALNPYGVSPIALSLKEAAESDIIDLKRYKYSLILVTDGGESCGGDICAVVEELLRKKIDFRPYIVSLIDYAPLRKQYECLGEYLVVSKDSDIPVAVGKIVEEYKSTFIKPALTKQMIEKAIVNKPPSALKMNIPAFQVTAEKEIQAVEKPKPVEKKEPELLVIESIPADTLIVEAPAKKSNIVVEERVREKEKNIEKISSINTPHTLPQKYATEAVTQAKVPEYTAPVVDVHKPSPPPKPIYKPVKLTASSTKPIENKPPVVAPPKKIDYKIEREEAKETTVEIFFTNGKGKFYETAPKLVLSDSKTGKELHTFWRTVNAVGSPDPQNIPPGIYKLTIPGKDNFAINNLEVLPNQKNKFLIEVANASLRFEYAHPTNKAVVEYAARVKKALQRGQVHKQLCTQELEYEPDNYHIELNTLPRKHFNVDLEFGAIVTIKIDRPGYLQVTNSETLGQVQLYYQHGDRFEPFYKLNVNGNQPQQKLRLMPGPYKVVYLQNRGKPNATEMVQDFRVKSDMITELYLKP